MFRSVKPDTDTEDTGHPSEPVADLTELIPLVVLELSLAAPAEWVAFLADRDMSIIIDDIGRPAVSRSDARLLLTEQREAEARRRERAAELERQAVERDRLRQAQIWGGVPATAFPEGVSAASVMLTAAQDARPRRQSPLQHALANSGELVFHSPPSMMRMRSEL
jgi:hypothetical protein